MWIFAEEGGLDIGPVGGGIIGVLVGVLPLIGAWILKLMQTRHTMSKEVKADAIMHYVALVEHTQQRVNSLEEGQKEQAKELARVHESERECLKNYADAKEMIAKQNGIIANLTADLHRLELAMAHVAKPEGTT